MPNSPGLAQLVFNDHGQVVYHPMLLVQDSQFSCQHSPVSVSWIRGRSLTSNRLDRTEMNILTVTCLLMLGNLRQLLYRMTLCKHSDVNVIGNGATKRWPLFITAIVLTRQHSISVSQASVHE